jgi:RNA polymerase sigma-70 factor (ECF subfamily)
MNRISELTQTVKEHEAALIRYASRMLNDRDNARDAVQEAFIRFARNLEKKEKKAINNVQAWLYKVTRNICLDTLRSKKKRLELPLEENIDRFVCPQKAPDATLKVNEDMQMLRKMINNLEPREREILLLKLEHDKSYKEMAEIMEISVGNVGFILHNTMKKLKAGYRSSAGGESK